MNVYARIIATTIVAATLGCGAAYADVDDTKPFVYVVNVTAPCSETLSELLAAGFNIGSLHDRTATLYLSESEYGELLSFGYTTQLVETQPCPYASDKTIGYTAPDEIGALFASYAQTYPDLCRVYSLGTSVQGRDIWAIKITPAPDTPADKPVVKYISTMHGDEPVGTEMCLYFAEELLTEYGTDAYITDFLDRTIVWLVPMMNPDGFLANSRFNANNKDLNRTFPSYGNDYTGTWFDGEPLGDTGREPEVIHIMQWNASTHAALSANMHTGALVVNYPYDNDPGIPSGTEAPTPDDAMFQYISLQYSMRNQPMYASTKYSQGIVNGSDWYSITGGMMDWHYRFMGCPHVTLELSDTKRPAPSLLPQYWAENRDSMFAYAETAHIGVRGLTRDRNSDAPVWAKVLLEDNEQPVFSNPDFGNYHKLALAGTYNVSFHAEGYISYYVDDVVVNEGPATRVDVELSDGDINNDGVVNSTDIQLVVDAVLGRAIPFDADVDGRGLSATAIQAVINQSLL